MKAMDDLKGRWVLVTGASSGLGAEMTRVLAREHRAEADLVLGVDLGAAQCRAAVFVEGRHGSSRSPSESAASETEPPSSSLLRRRRAKDFDQIVARHSATSQPACAFEAPHRSSIRRARPLQTEVSSARATKRPSFSQVLARLLTDEAAWVRACATCRRGGE